MRQVQSKHKGCLKSSHWQAGCFGLGMGFRTSNALENSKGYALKSPFYITFNFSKSDPIEYFIPSTRSCCTSSTLNYCVVHKILVNKNFGFIF